jgi:mono/diheme cytochrome c family protein
MFSRTIVACIISVYLFSCSSPEATPEAKSMAAENIAPNEKGKKLFYGKCASCHMVNNDMSGPALKGVEDRWPDKKKLYAFIRNSEEVIRSDKYARELWIQWNQTQMLPHPDLTDEDITAILEYIRSVSQ